MQRKGLRFIPLLVALALLVGGCADTAPPTPSSAAVTVLAPVDFEIADYAGKPLVINFFGSWCGPCNAEAPELAEFAAGNPDVEFVGIAVDDTEGDAIAFMGQYGLGYPIVMDDGSLRSAWNVNGVPTTIFLRSDGREAGRIVGAASREQFEQSLAKAR